MKDRTSVASKVIGGAIILYIGIVYLLYYFDVIDYHLDYLWPGVLVILGAGIIVKAFIKEKKTSK